MPQPLVSILIPCHNAEPYVAEAIQSALSQDHERIEVIVLDDGSTDGSLEVIRRFADTPGFRWEAGPNRGGNAARNTLLDLAHGEFVQFLDADDLLLPSKIAVQLHAFQDSIDVVFSDYYSFKDGDEQCGKRETSIKHELIKNDLVAFCIEESVLITLPLHRRRHLAEAGGFDESLPCCQEYELHGRLAMRAWKNAAHVDQVLSGRREVEGSVSSNEARVYSVQAELLRKWFESLSNEDRLTKERSDAVARCLYICGRHLAKHGKRDESMAAFRLANKINPRAGFDVRWQMKTLSHLLGPYRAERLRTAFRRRTTHPRIDEK